MGRKRKTVAVNGSGKILGCICIISIPMSNLLPNTDNSSAGEPTNVVNNVLPVASGSKANQIKLRTENENMRRSGCLNSLVLPDRTRGLMKPTVEHVILTDNESEKEKEEEKETETEKVDSLPFLNEKELGVETQAEQVFGKTNESPSPNFIYKILYIQTQKKTLMEEHYDAIRRLEFARRQIAAYEKMEDTMGDASRELILVSDLEKLIGGGGATKHQMALNCMLSPSALDAAVAEADKNTNKKKTYKRKNKAN